MAASNVIVAELRHNRLLMGALGGGLLLSSAIVSDYRAMFPLHPASPQAFAAVPQGSPAPIDEVGGRPGYRGQHRGSIGHTPRGFARPSGLTEAPADIASRSADRPMNAAEDNQANQAPAQLAAANPADAPNFGSSGPGGNSGPGGSFSSSGGPDPIGGLGSSGGAVSGPSSSSGGTTTTSGGSTTTGGATTSGGGTTSGGINTSSGGNTSGGTNPVSPAPEPETWAMMIFGFALVGGVAYHRARRKVALLA